MAERVDYSIVVPVYNCSNLNLLVQSFKSVLIDAGYSAELILVDDASGVETAKEAEALALENGFITTIHLNENVGQVGATTCGIHHAHGKTIITMDDDLQYPMEDTVKLIHTYNKSYKLLIFGYPQKRMHNFRHRVAAKMIIWLFDYVVLPRYRKINFYTTFRIFDRSLFFEEEHIKRQVHLFYVWEIPISDMHSIPVNHQPRKTGKSTYTLRKKFNTLKTPLLFCFYKLATYLFLLLIPSVFLTKYLYSNQTFFYVTLTCCALSFLFLSFAKRKLGEWRFIKYEIQRISKK